MLMNRAVDPDMIYTDPKLSRILPLLSNFELRNLPPLPFSTSYLVQRRKKLTVGKRLDIFDYIPGGNLLID